MESWAGFFGRSRDTGVSWSIARENPLSVPVPAWDPEAYADEQTRGLVRQVFLSGWPAPARQVVFSAVHESTNIAELCMQVATALAEEVRSDVCLVGEDAGGRSVSRVWRGFTIPPYRFTQQVGPGVVELVDRATGCSVGEPAGHFGGSRVVSPARRTETRVRIQRDSRSRGGDSPPCGAAWAAVRWNRAGAAGGLNPADCSPTNKRIVGFRGSSGFGDSPVRPGIPHSRGNLSQAVIEEISRLGRSTHE